jgi:hypothetical protein
MAPLRFRGAATTCQQPPPDCPPTRQRRPVKSGTTHTVHSRPHDGTPNGRNSRPTLAYGMSCPTPIPHGIPLTYSLP